MLYNNIADQEDGCMPLICMLVDMLRIASLDQWTTDADLSKDDVKVSLGNYVALERCKLFH